MTITIETTVDAPPETAWHVWTSPEFITQWNFASEDWTCPRAEIDLRPGGKFNYRMEAKNGSMGFDFEGEFTSIDPPRHIAYTMGDQRNVTIDFIPAGPSTRVVETFEAENEHSVEVQRQGWQAILETYKRVAESTARSSGA